MELEFLGDPGNSHLTIVEPVSKKRKQPAAGGTRKNAKNDSTGKSKKKKKPELVCIFFVFLFRLKFKSQTLKNVKSEEHLRIQNKLMYVSTHPYMI